MGGGAVPVQFPLPELLPIIRPDSSRCVPVNDPAGLPLVVELPVSLPEAARYWVLLPELLPVRVSALPAERPLASR
jgi:hypothetical protein